MLFYFFFQAEDGIRDWSVTGVQTCALPISASVFDTFGQHHKLLTFGRTSPKTLPEQHHAETCFLKATQSTATVLTSRLLDMRSEERRVGKECRSRWSREE